MNEVGVIIAAATHLTVVQDGSRWLGNQMTGKADGTGTWWPGGPSTGDDNETANSWRPGTGSTWWPSAPAIQDHDPAINWWLLLLCLIGSALALWLAHIVTLWVASLITADKLQEIVPLLPDLSDVLERLAADAMISKSVRIGLAVVIGYSRLPIDPVLKRIPNLRDTRDAILIALAIRWIVSRAGTELLSQYWVTKVVPNEAYLPPVGSYVRGHR